jgi:hypothetical protein
MSSLRQIACKLLRGIIGKMTDKNSHSATLFYLSYLLTRDDMYSGHFAETIKTSRFEGEGGFGFRAHGPGSTCREHSIAGRSNPQTRRPYKNDVDEFVAFSGLSSFAELRGISPAHVDIGARIQKVGVSLVGEDGAEPFHVGERISIGQYRAATTGEPRPSAVGRSPERSRTGHLMLRVGENMRSRRWELA